MKKKIFIFTIISLFLPLLSATAETKMENCSIETIPEGQTSSGACFLSGGRMEAYHLNCGNGIPAENKVCCCKISTTYDCRWQESLTGIALGYPNDWSHHAPKCKTTEAKNEDTKCDPDNKPDNQMVNGQNMPPICCCPGAEEGAGVTKAKFQIPIMSIPINTVELTDAYCTNQEDHSGTCEIPWIAQYIQGVYKYGLGVGGILAAIVLMAGGLLWLVSAGDASKISQAKDLILGSVTGLIILMGTYLILDQINPGLNNLKSISLKMLETTNFSDAEVSTPDDQAENPYQEGCTAARNGDLSICRGYGEQEPGKMTNIAGTNLKAKSEVVEKYNTAMACVREKNGGKNIFGVSAAWRSPARQISIKAEKGTQAATPCCSNHGKGVALDLYRLDGKKMTWDHNNSSGLTTCMNAQGLNANLNSSPNEPWHWSPSGR